MSKEKEYLAKLLGVKAEVLENLDQVMVAQTKKKGVLEKVYKKNQGLAKFVLDSFKVSDPDPEAVSFLLRQAISDQEKGFFKFLDIIQGKDIFERSANLVSQIAQVGKGWFLKKEFSEEILTQCPPETLLKTLKIETVPELLKKHNVIEIFSALRFMESPEWMHEIFDKIYSKFTPADFEEREIEIRVLSPIWQDLAADFIKKKHHNVSHLKEFGVIFVNPVKEDIPGKFLRDFALLLHYFHEIEFYSKLFKHYSKRPDFAERFKALLRGDVPSIDKSGPGDWLIIQRYLAKEDPEDPRLFVPHINPESLHWMRGERDLTLFRPQAKHMDLNIWHNLDWVGGLYKGEEPVSFDLEDNAMSLVSFMEGKRENFNYHQQEAMWTKIFMEYAGGEEKTEKLLIENFEHGVIEF